MSFNWTPHRFAGGALAFDVANSVVMRFDNRRRIDRFAMAEQLNNFAEAANRHSSDAGILGPFAPVADERQPHFLALREAIDAYFRDLVLQGAGNNQLLAKLLETAAAIIRAHPQHHQPASVDLATARSALRLIANPEIERLKICPNCEWLFVDKSKNRSRSWCDMTVCGNRAKARLHYQKKKREMSR
jgi:predicted RNA-binding Zn ribbon-like protein